MAKAKKGYFGSTEPQARKVLEQIQSTQKKARAAKIARQKKGTTKVKKRSSY